MLVISRKIEEGIRIGDTIEIRILDVFSTDNSGSRKSKAASIGITAPREVPIIRGELREISRQNQQAERSTQNVTGQQLAAALRNKKKADQG